MTKSGRGFDAFYGRLYEFWNATNACCDLFGNNPDDSTYLRDVIEESDLNLDDTRQASDLPSINTGIPFSEAKKSTVENFEREYLLRALRENDGNVSRTAQAIGMVRQSLQQKIRELDLRSEDWSRNGDTKGEK